MTNISTYAHDLFIVMFSPDLAAILRDAEPIQSRQTRRPSLFLVQHSTNAGDRNQTPIFIEMTAILRDHSQRFTIKEVLFKSPSKRERSSSWITVQIIFETDRNTKIYFMSLATSMSPIHFYPV